MITEKNLQETLNILPQNSEDYIFIKLINTLHDKGPEPLKSDKEVIDAYTYLK